MQSVAFSSRAVAAAAVSVRRRERSAAAPLSTAPIARTGASLSSSSRDAQAAAPLGTFTTPIRRRGSRRAGGVSLRVRAADAASADISAPSPAVIAPIPAAEGFATLSTVLGRIRDLPPSMRGEAAEASTKEVSAVLNGMKAGGHTTRWDCYPQLTRRNIFPNELAQMGVKDPDRIGRPSDTNDANFLMGVTFSTSALALVVGVTLPGDWGAFGSYLIGGVSLAVLAVGSTAPGLLAVAIDRFARISPQYRNRIARHEAAHFLIGFLLGVPVAGYSLGLGTAHTDFLEAKLELKINSRLAIQESTLLPLACVSMAGVAAEAMFFDEVQGQEGDLRDLQRILNKAEPRLSDAQQQALTRWAVWMAASMLRRHDAAFLALVDAMEAGAPVADCIKAIESAPQPTK